FRDAVKDHHHAEERRLLYVAVTRARHRLLITGSFWLPGAKKPRSASPFLTDLARKSALPDFAYETALETNPEPGDPETITWPMDPLGSRRARVERAAARVRESEPRPTRYDADIEALLAERAARREADQRIRLPHR